MSVLIYLSGVIAFACGIIAAILFVRNERRKMLKGPDYKSLSSNQRLSNGHKRIFPYYRGFGNKDKRHGGSN